MKSILIPNLFLWVMFLLSACGGNEAEPGCANFEEAEDPSPDTLAQWSFVKKGLHTSMASVDEHYFLSSVPKAGLTQAWKGTAWRGERVSVQAVLWSARQTGPVELELSDFRTDEGERLPSSIARAGFVRYVLTDEFSDGCGKRKPEDYPAYLYPDMIDTLACFKLKAKESRPVWISIDVPAGAVPGIYHSVLEVKSGVSLEQSLKLELEVLPRLLPPAREWKFHLDLWQNPFSVARWHGMDAWSEEHWKLLEPVMEMLASAGQKVITVSINKRPWGGQTQDQFESMIGWTLKADGSWEYDYSIFDRWVQFMMDLGIDKQINCYSMLPWSLEVFYFDELKGEEVSIKPEPGSEEFAAFWSPFLADFRTHLLEKGWLKICNIAMDERDASSMQAMLGLMEEVAPEFGIALADNKKSYKEYPDRIHDLCVSYNRALLEESDLEYRKSKGYISTYYVCCADEFPNTFTFSPPAEAVCIAWTATAMGLDGFLRWSYCSWVEDPERDSRFRTWPAGDTYLVYPGARSSIRFERLMEGIQDAEKIRILRKEFSAMESEEAQALLFALNEMLQPFGTGQKPADTEDLLNRSKEILLELSR